ncbi:hypothetical protein AXG93_2097s1080 [Marchantia polymorpha subsp. ruderalis]|uniref:Centrosomal protein of 162 kDa n=1 Tax=Marchantia polymorpha subsp. ruderalis TaxID=1480154 RepID=A0A176W159_MARPO|nr:hypothetical protein AXG93_2097s1080 [Marchantia polymorpha subsp. ruderalis]
MGKNNLERVENVKHQPSSSGECPQENLTNGGFKLHGKQSVDGYTPDHEEYDKVEDDPSEDNAGGSHAHQEHPHSGSPYGQAGKPQEAYVVDPPTQGHKMRSFQNSSDPTVEIVAGSTDNPNLQSSRRANVVLYSEKTIDPVISSSLFGDEALHKLLGQSAKTSYWARLCIKEPQNSATGELERPGHISGTSGSDSVNGSSKEHERHIEENKCNSNIKIVGRDQNHVTLKHPLDSEIRRYIGPESSPVKSISSGKPEATEATKSIWLSKDVNLNTLLAQGFSLERQQLNTGKVENSSKQIESSDAKPVANRKDLKTSSSLPMAVRHKNQTDATQSLRSKLEKTVGRTPGSKNQSQLVSHNSKTRRLETTASSFQALAMKSQLMTSPRGTKKGSSSQNLKSLYQGNSLERLIGDNEATNKRKNSTVTNKGFSESCGKGKSNEELEGLYVEFAENVANMRPSNGAANSVPSALSFEQIHPGSTSKLDDLNKQIAEERQEKQLIQKRFGDQHHEFERISRDKQELWEAKLRELQKDKYALQIRLQEVEAENPRQKIKRVGESVNLTEGELRRLRQEILEQEALIKGYQVENEKAVKKLKDIESTYKERAQLMAEENARLASQLANIQFAGCQTTIYGSTPNATKEIQALRTELFDLQSRETMLRLELEREKKNNQELGKSLATLNQDRENEVESLKQMLVKERLEHAQAVELKEEQTQLYLKSQDAVKALSKRLEDQDGIVADLRSKVEVFESQEEFGKENERDSRKPFQGQRNWSNIQKMKAIKRIEDLQKQVKKLEANLKLKNEHLRDNQQPLATSTDESEKVKSLQEEVRSLQHQIRDDNSRSVLQGLRHEHDQLKQEYSRVCAVTQQLKNQLRASAENDPSAAKKVKDLEKQVEDIRVFYIKKVRDLTRQLGDARKESSKMYTNMEARKTADKFNLKMNKLEETLAKRDAVIKKLQLKIKDLEAKKGNLSKGSGLGPNVIKSTSPSLLAISTLQQTSSKTGMIDHAEKPKEYLPRDIKDSHCNQYEDNTGEDLVEERKLLKPVLLRRNTKNVKEAVLSVAGGELPTSTSTEVASLRKQLEAAEIAREVLQKTCTETMERAALMSVQHQQMMRNVKEVHAMRVAGDRSCNRDDQEGGWQRKYKNQALEVENEVLESRVKDLSVELVDQTAQKSPRMAQLQFLRKRIEDMEARHKEREWEWQKILQDTRRLPSSKRQDKDEELWQMAYKAKYEEMESFKNEVDSVLEAALAFQNSQMENAEHKLFTRNDAKR